MCESTKAKIAVMQAFVDGKNIEYRHGGHYGVWRSTPKPPWDWGGTEYRIYEDMELRAYHIYSKAWNQPQPATTLVPTTRLGLRALINAVKAGEIT